MYDSYISAFKKFAEHTLRQRMTGKNIPALAIQLNEKANELLQRAALNQSVDLVKLQKELFETGRDYVRRMGGMSNQQSVISNQKTDIS